MKEIIEILRQERAVISDVLKEIENRIAQSPEGSLRCEKKRDKFQYYYYDGKKESKRSGVYIKQKDVMLAAALADKEYSMKMYPLVQSVAKDLNSLLSIYEDHKLEEVYEKLYDGRKKLITPYFQTEEETIKKWMAEEYESKPFPEDNQTEFYTFKGERVRSKSEKMIADEFCRYQIPYKYEHPITLNVFGKNVVFHPDFTVLSKKTEIEILVEHFGMMDNEKYVSDAMTKLEIYERNGYLLGKNLLLFHETSASPLSIKIVKMYIEAYLI